MNWRFISLIVLILMLTGGNPGRAQNPPVIDVTKKFEPIPLALVPFELEGRTDPALRQQLEEILEYDLDFSGYFHLLSNTGQIAQIHQQDEQSGRIGHDGWKSIGADAVVKGLIREKRGDKIEIELRLYYTKGAYRIIGKKFTTEEKHFRRLVHLLSDQIVYNLTGNPGIAQSRIAFIYETFDKGELVKELYMIDYDGHPDSLVRLTHDRKITAMPAWSPDGNSIAFTSYLNNNPDLYILDLERGSRSRVSSYPGLNNSADWRPNGEEIIMVMSKDGNSEIYRRHLSRGNLTRLTFSRSIESSPCYSPDGSRIVFTSDRGRRVQLYTMDANGKGIQRISPSDGWYDLADWSPYGDLLTFIGSRDSTRRFDIFISRPDGSGLQQLTQDKQANENPVWSPDGRHILFRSKREGNWNLYVMNRQGGDLRRITFLPGNCHDPVWSPAPKP